MVDFELYDDKVGTEEKWKMAIDYPDFKSLENISEEEITERLEHSLRHKLEDSQSTKTKNTENIENTEDKLVAENFQHIEKNMEKTRLLSLRNCDALFTTRLR